jgi:hypothetical protein
MAIRNARHAGGVSHREVVAGLERQLGVDLDLAALVHEERAIGNAVDRHALEGAHRAHDPLGVAGVHAGDRHVADDIVRFHAHEVDRPEHRLRLGDGVRDPRERAALLGHVQAHREAIGGRGPAAAGGRTGRGLVGHRGSFAYSQGAAEPATINARSVVGRL